MRGMENMVVGGYNEHVSGVKNLQETYPDQKFLMSLTVFDHEIATLVHPSPIEALQELPADAFTPRGSTALLDAIGKSIHLIESEFAKAIRNDEIIFQLRSNCQTNQRKRRNRQMDLQLYWLRF